MTMMDKFRYQVKESTPAPYNQDDPWAAPQTPRWSWAVQQRNDSGLWYALDMAYAPTEADAIREAKLLIENCLDGATGWIEWP